MRGDIHTTLRATIQEEKQASGLLRGQRPQHASTGDVNASHRPAGDEADPWGEEAGSGGGSER